MSFIDDHEHLIVGETWNMSHAEKKRGVYSAVKQMRLPVAEPPAQDLNAHCMAYAVDDLLKLCSARRRRLLAKYGED